MSWRHPSHRLVRSHPHHHLAQVLAFEEADERARRAGDALHDGLAPFHLAFLRPLRHVAMEVAEHVVVVRHDEAFRCSVGHREIPVPPIIAPRISCYRYASPSCGQSMTIKRLAISVATALLFVATAAAASPQNDPIGYRDDLGLHTYVGNDPANKTDPTGRIIVIVGSPDYKKKVEADLKTLKSKRTVTLWWISSRTRLL